MYNSGLLVLTAPIRSLNQFNIGKYFAIASKNVRNRLYLNVEPGKTTLWPLFKRSPNDLGALARFIPLAYNWATTFCRHLDVRVILAPYKNLEGYSGTTNWDFDVVFTDSTETESNVQKYVQKQFNKTCFNIIRLEDSFDHFDGSNENTEAPNGPVDKTYDTVVLGGTFDRLHNGHKVLLSCAALRTKKSLIVGVTSGDMLKRKILWELIEPVEERMRVVKEFLEDVDPTVNCTVIPIFDPLGPTIHISDLDCIVVSEETKRGGDRVNIERAARSMKELDMVVIRLLEEPSIMMVDDEKKLSSSDHRKKLLGSYIKEPNMDDVHELPVKVALIGELQRGNALVSEELKRLGSAVIDCNDIIQSCLKRNSDLVLELFPGSKEEEMAKLQIQMDQSYVELAILKEKSRREKVSSEILSLVKPAIENKLVELRKQGVQHVVLKMPAFADDNWLADVHQIWGLITTESEYMKQLKSGYNLSDGELEQGKGIEKLPSPDVMRKANLFFSHHGNDEFLKEQVQKAWSKLCSLTTKLNIANRY